MEELAVMFMMIGQLIPVKRLKTYLIGIDLD
jgi:hypothetical protein